SDWGGGKGSLKKADRALEFVEGKAESRVRRNRPLDRSGLRRREFAEQEGAEPGIVGSEFHQREGSLRSAGSSSRRRLRPVWIRKPTLPLLRPVAAQIS